MTAEAPAYSVLYIRAWTLLSVIFGVVMLTLFVAGPAFMDAGKVVWDLLRWIASPLI